MDKAKEEPKAAPSVRELAEAILKTGAAPNERRTPSWTPEKTAANAGKLTPQTIHQQRTARKVWLSDLLDKLRMARGMEVPTDVEDYLAHSLDQLGFTADQARMAECWILFCDWKYRGATYTLSLADFTDPDIEAVRRVSKSKGFTMRTGAEMKKALQYAYEAGKRDGLAEAKDVRPSEAVKDLCLEILELKEDVASLGEQLTKEASAREKAEQRLERLRDRMKRTGTMDHG